MMASCNQESSPQSLETFCNASGKRNYAGEIEFVPWSRDDAIGGSTECSLSHFDYVQKGFAGGVGVGLCDLADGIGEDVLGNMCLDEVDWSSIDHGRSAIAGNGFASEASGASGLGLKGHLQAANPNLDADEDYEDDENDDFGIIIP